MRVCFLAVAIFSFARSESWRKKKKEKITKVIDVYANVSSRISQKSVHNSNLNFKRAFIFFSSQHYNAIEIAIRRHGWTCPAGKHQITPPIIFDEREHAMCSAEFFRVWNKKFHIYVFISPFCCFSFSLSYFSRKFRVSVNVAALGLSLLTLFNWAFPFFSTFRIVFSTQRN